MAIEIKKIKKEKIVFLVKGINNTLANAIRRSVAEIPVLAIDTVEFSKNDSALYDEILAHRLGLVPLQQDDSLKLMSECSCKGKGCSKCMVKFKLEAKGPKMVYSGEFKGSSIKSIYPEIPLVWLDKDQELILNVECLLGFGKDHAKFSPGLLFFKENPELEYNGNSDKAEECLKLCPENALSLVNKKLVLDNAKCTACEYCVEKCPKNELKINVSDRDFVFTIESFGQFSPEEIFIKAVESLNENLNRIKKFVK